MNVVTAFGIAAFFFVAWFTWRQATHAQQGDGQTKRGAIIEAWVNIAIGFTINYCANLLLLPLIGAHLTAANNFWLGWSYTAVSILRQYAIRRWFNERIVRAARRLAGEDAPC